MPSNRPNLKKIIQGVKAQEVQNMQFGSKFANKLIKRQHTVSPKEDQTAPNNIFEGRRSLMPIGTNIGQSNLSSLNTSVNRISQPVSTQQFYQPHRVLIKRKPE